MVASHRVSPPLTLSPRPSRRLALFVALTHGLALGVVAVLPLGWLAVPLVLAVGMSAVHAVLDRVLMRAPWSIRSATWRSDGSWILTLATGRDIEASLLPATFVSLPLISLVFKVGPVRRRALTLWQDSLDADRLRRLRQRLRIEGGRQTQTLDAG